MRGGGGNQGFFSLLLYLDVLFAICCSIIQPKIPEPRGSVTFGGRFERER